MSRARMIRNFSFLVLMCVCLFPSHRNLLAVANHMADFCSNWGSYGSCGSTGDWTWSASADFSEEGDPMTMSAQFCSYGQAACDADCQSFDYAEYLAEGTLCSTYGGRFCNPYCYATYAGGNSCSQGYTAGLTCSCSAFNWCLE